jgi:predicted phosphodiesterase
METIRFIGDVHGLINGYVGNIVDAEFNKNIRTTIQVGDMGAGFTYIPTREYLNTAYGLTGNHRFIRGNHDDPAVCKDHDRWIADGHTENGMMFIGGAWSIDWKNRVPGKEWWPDEELSYVELEEMIDKAKTYHPEIMVTHDAPESIIPKHLLGYANYRLSRTQQALDVIFKDVKPRMWIFGHWHMNRVFDVDLTRFICRDELSIIDIDV